MRLGSPLSPEVLLPSSCNLRSGEHVSNCYRSEQPGFCFGVTGTRSTLVT